MEIHTIPLFTCNLSNFTRPKVNAPVVPALGKLVTAHNPGRGKGQVTGREVVFYPSNDDLCLIGIEVQAVGRGIIGHPVTVRGMGEEAAGQNTWQG